MLFTIENSKRKPVGLHNVSTALLCTASVDDSPLARIASPERLAQGLGERGGAPAERALCVPPSVCPLCICEPVVVLEAGGAIGGCTAPRGVVEPPSGVDTTA
eukprot:COSAG03_NODE_1786_length_3522_cov_474.402279_2_plen_103_part_00